MRVRLRPLHEQVIVITGASSGIGLTTARAAARRGARVVLCARDETSLRRAVDEIREDGGDAVHAVADVADVEAVARVAELAVATYGRIDTWVNDAGVSIYGSLRDVSLDDARRLFETNYWGVVHGSLVAVPYLRVQGGALINVGSVLSDTAMPLQGHYSASKHAVKGFTDALRMELEKEGEPISVSLVKPGAIDTPYTEHARNYLMTEPTHQPPVYAPEVVAEAILACAERPRRDVRAGGSAKMLATMQTVAPRLADRYKEATAFGAQHSTQPPFSTDTLHAPQPGSGRARGSYEGRVLRTSAYTRASLHPVSTLLGAAALGLAVALVARGRD